MPFQKFPCAVFAAQLKDIVAHRGLHQYGKVSTSRHRQCYGTDIYIEDRLCFRAYAQTVKLLHILVVGRHQIDNQVEKFFRADGSFAENVADIQYTQPAHFQKVSQHRRTAAFQHFRTGTEQFHRVVRNQAVSA